MTTATSKSIKDRNNGECMEPDVEKWSRIYKLLSDKSQVIDDIIEPLSWRLAMSCKICWYAQGLSYKCILSKIVIDGLPICSVCNSTNEFPHYNSHYGNVRYFSYRRIGYTRKQATKSAKYILDAVLEYYKNK